MRNEDLEVVKIALAVVAPRTSEKLFERGATSFLAHDGCAS
jgi:hypothetical protein